MTPAARGDAPRVLGIVLNFNGRDLTLATLESLLALEYPSLDLLVVDNGSTDGSDAAVAERFPSVRRLRTEENLGISGGLNLGFRYGLEAGHDFLMPMNNDIEVAPDLLDELVSAASRDAAIGCVGPKCYYFYGDRRRIWSAGGRLRFREAVTRERGMGELDRGQYDVEREVDYVNGALMLIRRDAMLATGLWDPVYQVSVEDADWCVRMKRAGFRCWYAPRARLWHMVSPTTGGYRAGRTFRTGRSTAIFVRRYAGLLGWLSWLFWAAIAFPAALLRELPRRNASAVLAKYRGFAAGLREALPPPPAGTPRPARRATS
ncbi:MAG: glycosyltransferase family 2 protein [Acidobacteria bacterium]|nr:glycosyltransferase family 2 protein [Acidobacteriota bacterium]MCB9378016.1 glycosyltransferase family 2 protein [Holophagales bacterium]